MYIAENVKFSSVNSNWKYLSRSQKQIYIHPIKKQNFSKGNVIRLCFLVWWAGMIDPFVYVIVALMQDVGPLATHHSLLLSKTESTVLSIGLRPQDGDALPDILHLTYFT